MKSKANGRFWRRYGNLPEEIQALARKNYRLWQQNHNHPSLHFKKLHGNGSRFSIRIGDHYRAMGLLREDTVEWVWIGSHEEYNKLLSS